MESIKFYLMDKTFYNNQGVNIAACRMAFADKYMDNMYLSCKFVIKEKYIMDACIS